MVLGMEFRISRLLDLTTEPQYFYSLFHRNLHTCKDTQFLPPSRNMGIPEIKMELPARAMGNEDRGSLSRGVQEDHHRATPASGREGCNPFLLQGRGAVKMRVSQ